MSKSEIASAAAALVVQEGLEYGPAKHRALRQLGYGPRTPLPSNDELEQALVEYIALFCADTQAAELRALRRLALAWMQRLAVFRPHLSGAVWHGTATRLSDIYLQLFCDDEKSVEITMIDMGIRYAASTVRGLHGDPVEALSVQAHSAELGETVGVHLMLYDFDAVRGALRPDAQGRSPRGDAVALERLLGNETETRLK